MRIEGQVEVARDPTTNLELATKQYADAISASYGVSASTIVSNNLGLGNHGSVTTASTNEQWGGTLTLANTAVGEVTVIATVGGYVQNWKGGSLSRVSLEFSFDGGSTWVSHGAGDILKDNDGADAFDRVPITRSAHQTGTATSDVQVRVQVNSDNTTYPEFLGGRLHATVLGSGGETSAALTSLSYEEVIGTAASGTEFTISHNLASDKIVVGVWDEAANPPELVHATVQRLNKNQVKLVFAESPDLDQYRVIVHGSALIPSTQVLTPGHGSMGVSTNYTNSPSGSFNVVSFDTAIAASGSVEVDLDNNVLRATEDGLYLITGVLAGQGSSQMITGYLVNNETVYGSNEAGGRGDDSGSFQHFSFASTLELTAGDEVSMCCYMSSTDIIRSQTRFDLTRIPPPTITAGGGGKDTSDLTERRVMPALDWYTGASTPEKLTDGVWGGSNDWAGVGSDTSPHMIVDMQEERVLGSIEMFFYTGDARSYYGVSVSTSLDGENWTWLYYTDPSMTRVNEASLKVDGRGRSCRYLRTTMYGNTSNSSNHLDELIIMELVPSEEIV